MGTFSDDDLKLDGNDVVPKGGSWGADLVSSPRVNIDAELFWSFTFDCEQVDLGDDMVSPVSIAVAWAPIPGVNWRAMTGAGVSSETFGEPVEATVYFFEHHAYSKVELKVLEQNVGRIRVSVSLSGDLDGLGLHAVEAEAWLDFEQIAVDLPGIENRDDAWAALTEWTDPTGLRREGKPHQLRFRLPDIA